MSMERDADGEKVARVYFGLGSNLGDRDEFLRFGVKALEAVAEIDAVSSVYDTAPMLVTDQPRFHNLVCTGRTRLAPLNLLHELKAIEREAGRTEGPRYGPRPLDIDILFYDDLTMTTPELTIPHPGLAERGFVLAPLAEIAPNLRHPVLGETIEALLKAVGSADVRRVGTL